MPKPFVPQHKTVIITHTGNLDKNIIFNFNKLKISTIIHSACDSHHGKSQVSVINFKRRTHVDAIAKYFARKFPDVKISAIDRIDFRNWNIAPQCSSLRRFYCEWNFRADGVDKQQ